MSPSLAYHVQTSWRLALRQDSITDPSSNCSYPPTTDVRRCGIMNAVLV